MTTGNKNLSIPLPIEEYDAFVAEAQGAPHHSTAAELGRKIIRGRHEMAIEVAPDGEKQKAYYEGRIQVLETDRRDLLDRLSEANRSNGLSGVELKGKHQEKHVEEQIAKVKQEMKQEQLTEKLQHTEEQLRLANEKLKELETENEELTEQVETDKRFQGYIEKGGQALGYVLEKSPVLQQRISEGGLSGLIFGTNSGQGALSGTGLNDNQQQDLAIGTAIRHDFPGDKYEGIIDLLRFFKAYPGVPASIMRAPNFQQFVQQTT